MGIFSQNADEEGELPYVVINSSQKIKRTTAKEIDGEMLRQLPRKAIDKLTHIINAAFRLQYVPKLWKVAEVIMISKPGKPPNNITSYGPISLLPVMLKLFEKGLCP